MEPVAPYPVAIVGAGNMGGAMAQRLLAQGWPVQVCDVDASRRAVLQAAGAEAHVLPAAAVHSARACVVAVVDAAQTETVLFGPQGVAQAMPLGGVVLLCPTLAPVDVEGLARRLVPHGLHAVDAPMSGGPARALDGSMSLMVACPRAVFDRYDALFQALAGRLFWLGERIGDGARTKLVNNLAAAINLAAAAEVMALAQRLGLDAAQTLTVMEQSSGQSWIGSDRLRRSLAGDHQPRAHLSLLQKDTRLAVQAADSVGFQGPLGPVVRDLYAQAAAAGLAGQDDAVLYDWLSRRS